VQDRPTKEIVNQLLDELPDDCTIVDVLSALDWLIAVQRGEADAEEGRLLPREHVMNKLRAKWNRLGA
jgi:predicted transcriptional regulator